MNKKLLNSGSLDNVQCNAEGNRWRYIRANPYRHRNTFPAVWQRNTQFTFTRQHFFVKESAFVCFEGSRGLTHAFSQAGNKFLARDNSREWMEENRRRRQLACSTDLSFKEGKGRMRDILEGVGWLLWVGWCMGVFALILLQLNVSSGALNW